MDKLQEALLAWYAKQGRHDLPWRHTNDPYKVYVSEIMLQQTQVQRVLEHYYFQFLETFPDLQSLAEASEEQVLRRWQGLGYYSRARNMKKTAELTAKSGLPGSFEQLLKLPGIGEYTAKAILCFGFKQPAAPVDANIKRVMLRLFGETEQSRAKALAQEFLNTKNPFEHNQALLDLGATVCMAKSPSCLLCPMHSRCRGKSEPLRYGERKKVNYETKTLHLLVAQKGERYAMKKSADTLYKNLWGFPERKKPPAKAQKLGSFKHSYTKYRLSVNLYLASEKTLPRGCEWVGPQTLPTLPISNLTRKAFALLER